MKRLFKVVDMKKTNTSLGNYETKKDAKIVRDEKNKGLKEVRYVVSRGKDHWRGESFYGEKQNEE